MRWLSVCLVLLVFGFGVLAGCEHDHYVIELKAEGDALLRKLTCWHDSGDKSEGKPAEISPLEAEVLERIGELYAKRESAATDAKQVFSGRFAGATPADVGGKGSFTRFVSPLGTTAAYVERFRGDDDLDGRLDRARRDADRLADVIGQWLTAELGKEPGFAKLKEWLDGDLHKDLKNLSALGLTGQAATSIQPESSKEFFVRLAQYFVERGYFAPKDIPAIARSLFSRDGAAALQHVQRFVARKMGAADDQPIPDALAFLGDAEKLERSLTRYLADSPFYKQYLAEWKKANPGKPETENPTPSKAMEDLVFNVLLVRFDLFGPTPDALDVTLACPVKPYATNGKWDDGAAKVAWSQQLDVNRVLPVECFAFWSEPNEPFQTKHFGKVVLRDENLAQYCIWYCGLKADEARQWDAMLKGCDPKQDFQQQIKAFRFEGEPPPAGDKTPASLADPARQLLLDAIQAASAGK